MKPAARLNKFGQSAWLDLIGRKLIRSGGLVKMVEVDGIRGVTANPAIFEKAIAESDEYDEELGRLIERGKTPLEIYDALIIGDVQTACDALRPLFDRVNGADGFVSLEVSPAIARDTAKTIEEAKKYWAAVDRPNLFIKIPANPEGIDAIRQATALGISVNITLIFSNIVYAQVIEAYLSGLEERVSKGLPISQIHSVASFFVSRVDSAVDKKLPEGSPLRGKIAVANARLAYQLFLKSIHGPRWKAVEAKGATRQRPLWASTGTKNKAYSDVLYVETLIGRDTVNTLPLATLNAFNDHGKVADTVEQGVDEARVQMKALAAAGIDLEEVCGTLTEEGLDLFANALISLLKTIEGRSLAQRSARATHLLEKPGKRKAAFEQGLDDAAKQKVGARLWAKDAALAPKPPGFLDLIGKLRHDAPELASFAREAAERFKHCAVLGRNDGAEALARILGKREGGLGFAGLVPALLGLDVGKLLDAADQVALASGASVPLKENLAVRLGALFAGCARAGANKLTLLLSPQLAPLGPWVQQLFEGITGITVIQGEPLAATYGDDRVFVSLSLSSEKHDVSFLADAGHPLVQWQLPTREALFGELLRWAIAAAATGALLELNPFADK